MDRLEIAIALIQEAQAEKLRMTALNDEIETLRGLEGREYDERRSEIEDKYEPLPRGYLINDNLKVARRLLKDEYV